MEIDAESKLAGLKPRRGTHVSPCGDRCFSSSRIFTWNRAVVHGVLTLMFASSHAVERRSRHDTSRISTYVRARDSARAAAAIPFAKLHRIEGLT